MHLKPKIIAIILPVLLLQVVVLVVPAFIVYQQFFSTQVESHIADAVKQVEIGLNTRVQAQKADTLLFSESLLLNRYLRIQNETIRFNVLHKVLLDEFSSFMQAHPEYIEISLVLPDGYEEVSLHRDDINNISDEEQDTFYFNAISQSAESAVTLTGINPDTGSFSMVAVRKILQGKLAEQLHTTEKTLKAYLVVKTDFDFLQKGLSASSIGEKGFIVLRDGVGRIIAEEDSDNYLSIEMWKKIRLIGHVDGLNLMELEADNARFIVGHQELGYDMHLTIAWPKAELNELLRDIGQKSLTLATVVIGVSLLLLFWALNRLLIGPILSLGTAAKRMGEGDVWTFTKAGEDELTDLSTTIREMGENLLAQKQQIHDIAYMDSLTQLPNRLQFLELLGDVYDSAGDDPPEIALLFLDLDGFKQVNDRCGHETGDKLLTAVAGRLKNALRTQDTVAFAGMAESVDVLNSVARLGGDEFTVLLKGITDPDGIIIVAERILKALNNPFHIDNQELSIGTSIGVAMGRSDGESAGELLKNADTAMYDAKKQGKNTYRFYNRTSALASLKRIEIRDDLRRAIDRNELKLVYQPQIDPATGQVSGCEALVRWHMPEKGWIRPDIFIPIAEESGSIIPLGRWVLLEACHQVKAWQGLGCPAVPVSVNLSNVQVAREDIRQIVQDCLASTGLDVSLLTLEITESSIMQGQASIDKIRDTQQDGVKIALDDFGTGYSSLSALRGLPIDELKIDKSFIADLNTSVDAKSIVSAIIAMAQQLRLKVVAEGVENEEEMQFLKSKKVEVIQGYYFSKPLTPDQFVNFLRQSKSP